MKSPFKVEEDIEKSLTNLAKLIDKRARVVGQLNDPGHRKCITSLEKLFDAWKQWKSSSTSSQGSTKPKGSKKRSS